MHVDAAQNPRAEEVAALHALSAGELAERAGSRLVVLEDIASLHRHFARSIARTVRRGRESGRQVALVLPWGPTGQYPILATMLADESLSLKDSTLIFMDEYAEPSGEIVGPDHPLSFRGAARRWLLSLPEGLRPDPNRVLFPGESSAEAIAAQIEATGGIDACYGGIGVRGHVAFNEPEPGVSRSGVRLVRLNEFTRTINAIRAGVGGDLENFPRRAWTLGLRECFSARRVELYCRSDCGLDWAKTVLRLAVLGEPGDDYPVTWIRPHPNYAIVTNRDTADPPEIHLAPSAARPHS